MGAQHGAALAPLVRRAVRDFIVASDRLFETPNDRIRQNLETLDRFVPDEYRVEMQALADAAGVTYEDILALNTFLDTDGIVESEKSYCINLVAFGPATADGRLLHGRNLDFPAGEVAEKAAAVFLYRPQGISAKRPDAHEPRRDSSTSPLANARDSARNDCYGACEGGADNSSASFLSVAWAGFIGALTGMNEHGLTVTEISSRTRHVSPEGVPLMLLLRMILQYASDIEEAIEIIRSTPRTAGFNITLTDWRVPEAVCVEFDAERVGIRRARRSVLVVSENRLTPALSPGQRLSPSGVARHIRAHDLADQHYGRITPEVMIEILRDRWDAVYRRHGKSHNCLCSNETVQSVVFLPEERRAWISNRRLPAPDGEYAKYRLVRGAEAARPTPAATRE